MKPSLVVLAAGMGSRYGGIKQLDKFGPSGEKIIDYTIYDALQIGFSKIIFVIRKEIEEDFNLEILDKWSGRGDLKVVYQELDSLPNGYTVPEGRVKPWGTAHAVWMAEKEVKEPFAIVNSDDFYGRNSLQAAFDHLSGVDATKDAACLVGYKLNNTLTDHGTVNRGVCNVNNEGELTGIKECINIAKEGDSVFYPENGHKIYLEPETLVSMNLLGFSPTVFSRISNGFDDVYNQANENLKVEYGIPTVMSDMLQSGVKIPVIPTADNWYGVTYSEDKKWVQEQFTKLHNLEIYPKNLWVN
jgi:hypothetical protein